MAVEGVSYASTDCREQAKKSCLEDELRIAVAALWETPPKSSSDSDLTTTTTTRTLNPYQASYVSQASSGRVLLALSVAEVNHSASAEEDSTLPRPQPLSRHRTDSQVANSVYQPQKCQK